MKKLLIYLAIPILAACSAGGTRHDHGHAEKKEQAGEQLQLNAGAKWKLDEPTRANMEDISSILASVEEEKDIPSIGPALQAKTDELVKECKMAGPNHDALHVWMKSYLPHLKALKQGDNGAYTLLQKDMDVFNSHFE